MSLGLIGAFKDSDYSSEKIIFIKKANLLWKMNENRNMLLSSQGSKFYTKKKIVNSYLIMFANNLEN